MDSWQGAAAHQCPSQVWDHAHGLTEYQVWTCYRIATKQLNLYHAGRQEDNSCRASPRCHGVMESSTHIFWNCLKARACWSKLYGHWTGITTAPHVDPGPLLGCATRRAPAIPTRQDHQLLIRLQDDYEAGVKVWQRIWFLMSSICLSHLWKERNDAVFRGVQTTVAHSVARFWAHGVRQLTALAKRDHRCPDTAVQGAIMHACLDLFTLEPRDFPVASEVCHDSSPTPVLLSWLRSFQTSCT